MAIFGIKIRNIFILCMIIFYIPQQEISVIEDKFAYSYIPRPTLNNVMNFISDDKTDLNEYGMYYNCTDFASDLVRNARDAGFKAHVVAILYENSIGHSIVVFETFEGILYIEPQNDKIYTEVSIGKPVCTLDYCNANGDNLRRFYYEECDFQNRCSEIGT